MRIGRVADAVELQVSVAQARFRGLPRELRALRELDAVGCRLHAVVAQLAGVANGVQKVGDMVGSPPENCTDIWRRGLMEIALSSSVLMSSQVSSCTKPTWLASMKHGSHIMLQRLVRSTVRTDPRPCLMVLLPWLCSFSSLWARMSRPGNISSRWRKKCRIDGHDVFEMPVERAVLDHQDFAVPLDDLRLDFAGPFLQQDAVILFAVDDLLADLRHATGAQRIGFPRPAQGRLRLFTRLQQRLVRPLGREGRILGNEVVNQTKNLPRPVGSNRHRLIQVFDGLMHSANSSQQLAVLALTVEPATISST